MDPWRIGLLIASAVFFAFLLLRLRPRMPDSSSEEEEDEGESAPSGAEQRLYKRLRKLPEAAQRRVLKRLERALHTSEKGNGSADEPVD